VTLLLRLGLKNLLRHRLRTLLSMSAVIAGVWVLVLGKGFLRGMNENVIRGQEDTFSAHVLARPAGYPTEPMAHPVDELLTVDPQLASWLDAETGGARTGRTLFTPWLVTGSDRLRVRAFGFDPATDERVFPRTSWKVVGAVPVTAADGILLGRGVANLLELEAGDRVVVQTRTSMGAINALDVPIAGVVSVGNPAIDWIGVFVPRALTQDLIRNGERISHLAVRLPRRELADAFAPRLREQAGEVASVVSWRDETRDLLALQQVRQRALDFLVVILLLMSAATIANTILMAAYERVREIGTMRAMGMTGRAVLTLFVIEGALIGLAGGGVGALLGGLMARHWSIHGIDLSAELENQGGNLPMSAILYLEFSPSMIGGAVVFSVVTAMLASVYPAWVAARMAPAEAVRAR
jgi:putative ABC transport system permease protein